MIRHTCVNLDSSDLRCIYCGDKMTVDGKSYNNSRRWFRHPQEQLRLGRKQQIVFTGSYSSGYWFWHPFYKVVGFFRGVFKKRSN